MSIVKSRLMAAMAMLFAAISTLSYAQQSITNDPLVLQETNRANWEPGGKYAEFGSRGAVESRSGSINVTPTTTTNNGRFSIQSANISGSVNFNVNLSSDHPIDVHSPFDSSSSNSSYEETTGHVLGTGTNVKLGWNGTESHLSSDYDGGPGGTGAIDRYSYSINGTAQGIYLRPQSEIQLEDVAYNPNKECDSGDWGCSKRGILDEGRESAIDLLAAQGNISNWDATKYGIILATGEVVNSLTPDSPEELAVDVALTVVTAGTVTALKYGIKAGDKGIDAAKGIDKYDDFFEGSKYTERVSIQKTINDYHGFPDSVDGFAKDGNITKITGGDGKVRKKLEIRGSYKGRDGNFEYIKEPDGSINHRFFKPD